MIKILLADDQPLLLSALETILGAQADLTRGGHRRQRSGSG